MVGLDPPSVRAAKDRLRTEARAGRTVFMSTHTLAIAEEIADRIGIMDHGRLHFLGTVGELQRGLASRHTALEPLFLELLQSGNGRNGKGEDGKVDSEQWTVDSQSTINNQQSSVPSPFPLPPSSF
jgi:ABC-2 type transport system ATP-binding protein